MSVSDLALDNDDDDDDEKKTYPMFLPEAQTLCWN